jgi:ParB family chromosome partitioning protein
MARKNPFANLVEDDRLREAQPALSYAMRGASRSILSSIDEMATRADKLIEGQTVVELDTELVDDSFVQDRLPAADQEFSELLDAIREHGQGSPILVRPHPAKPGRYMVVFGHRRLRAAKALGRKVRAVVKAMQDEEHVVAQGQENSARANLSFIEKAFFAANIARLNYDADNAVIMAALAVDRATLSKMLSVAALPSHVLHAIGPAKSIGRDRWYDLKILLEKPALLEVAREAMRDERYLTLSSDERFNSLMTKLKATKNSTRARSASRKWNWAPKDGSLAAEMTLDGKRFILAINAKGADAQAFGDFLSENLAKLYEAFRQGAATSMNGD